MAGEIQFNRDIRPILSAKCMECHGPDEHERKGKLRLDQSSGIHGALRELDGVAAIKPGSISESEVWRRILSEDPDEVMPPPEAKKQALTEAEKQRLKQWIEEGAEFEDFWAFVPPSNPPKPIVNDSSWSGQAIDGFVKRRLEFEGLQPTVRADRRSLIRRVTMDLTGLPPTPKEIEEFLTDNENDAYERSIDRLLSTRQYGEHFTKYWLDLVRFADTNGIHHDHLRDLTPYRDWVIRAFNDNLSYADFLTYQLAGDLYQQPTRDQLIASGFNRLHLIIDVGTALPEESYTKNVIDRVTSVGTAFMGLTVQCAVCHDHKYDPITAKDFYGLFAFFNNLDAKPETGGRSGTDFKRGLQAPFINLTTAEQEAELAQMTAKITALKGDKGAKKEFDEWRKKRDDLEMSIPGAMIMKEREEVRPAYLLIRGAYDKPGEEVARNTPGFLAPLKKASPGGRATRMDLADWFVGRENPLTARVAVNRFWQQLFGVGLVKTSEDFGAQGDWPSHPDLLDHLAVSFMDSGWDIKALVKQIVLSETYQQASEALPERFKVDPENRLLARGSRFRMDSEMIRDQVLATSGLLNPQMFGKSVKPPQPDGLWKSVGMPSSYPREYRADSGDQIFRRSVYTFWKRGMPPPQMTILNAPTREACIARRERTNTPLQALLLLNEHEYIKAARTLALKTLAKSEQDDEARLNMVYEIVTSSLPDERERGALLGAVADMQVLYQDNPELANEFCEGVEPPEGVGKPELAAWTMVISSLYNLDITKTRQ